MSNSLTDPEMEFWVGIASHGQFCGFPVALMDMAVFAASPNFQEIKLL